jgi:O-antigen/teichoic acid export membrane protein
MSSTPRGAVTRAGVVRRLVPEFVKRRVRGRPMLARLLGNSAWQIGDKVSRMGVGVVVNAYVARYLGPDGYGLINFAVALVALFSAIALFGLPQVVVRDLIERPAERARILASALSLRLLGGVTAISLGVVTTFLLRSGDAQSVLVVLLVGCSALPQAWDIIDYDYQSRINARPVVMARNTSFFVLAALRVVMVLLRAPLAWFAAALSAEMALAAVLMARRWRADGLGVSIRCASASEIRQLASAAWPLIITGLSVSLYMRVDQVMLARMMGNAGVGLFSAAVRVSEALYFLPVAVTTTVAPALTALRRRSVAEYDRRLVAVMRALVWPALGVAVLFTLCSHPIILALYGPRYSAAAEVLAIHTWAGALVCFGVCGQLWLTNEGYLKYSMYQTVFGAAVNIALNLVVIPRFGIIGAAVASCAGQFASTVLMIGLIPKTRHLFALQMATLVPALRVAGRR